jgi:hypothetical protein
MYETEITEINDVEKDDVTRLNSVVIVCERWDQFLTSLLGTKCDPRSEVGL